LNHERTVGSCLEVSFTITNTATAAVIKCCNVQQYQLINAVMCNSIS